MKRAFWACMAIVVALAVMGLSSCAGWSVSVSSPYGDVTADEQGNVSIKPLPIVFPTK